jgi:hypothetical protein
MGLFEHFPYTNFHDLNLDWIIQALKDLDIKVDTLEERVTEAAKQYVDGRIADFVSGPMQDMQDQIDGLENEMTAFETNVQNQFAEYTSKTDGEIEDFENLINSQIVLLRAEIAQAKSQFQTLIEGANSYTDQQIALQMSKIPDLVQAQILEVHVWNLLTGEYVDIQNMFDYLCTLHVDNGSTNDEIAAKNNTFADMSGYNATFHQMLINSKLLVEQK